MRISGNTASSSSSGQAPKGNLGSLKYLWHYLAPYKAYVCLALLALLITSSSVLGLGYGLRYLVDEGISKGDMSLLNDSYSLLMGIIVMLAATTYARYFLVTWIGEKVVSNIREDMYAHLVKLDVTFYETNRIGELLSRLTTDTTLIQSVVGSSVSIALRNAVLLIGGMSMLFITSFELTQYVLLIVPLVVAPIIFLGKRVRKLSRETQDRVADINVQAEETLSAIQTIQAFTLEHHQISRFNGFVDDTLRTATKRIKMRSLLTAIVITLVLGAIATVLLFGGKAVINGTISAGELSSFVFYAMIVAGSTGAISEVIGDLQRAAGAVERLTELKAESSSIPETEQPVTLADGKTGNITFENVSFHYPSRPDEAALHDVSFNVKQGQTTAIVGPSGGGKTTVFRLLLRYYDPASGNITLENTPLDQLALNDLRQRIGIVSQDPIIFSASAYDNIALGNVNASEADVKDAANHAEILEFLESLPDGLESYLGEKGVRLSGGQKQRVAIARALVRSPDILLLDEATSALDSENETKVQRALDSAMQNRTTLVIAHRLSTIRNADNIILIDNGHIVAQGTHEQLLANNTLYQKLAKVQFKDAA